MDLRSDPLIVIPTLNRTDLLDACVTAVKSTAPCARVQVVGFGWPFADHCNYGATFGGDPIVVLNDDAEVQRGWLEALCEPFEDQRVGITGARLTYADGRIQHAGVRFYRSHGEVLVAENVLEDLPSREVEAVTGACMAVRRECWEQLGGFDTGYVNGYEDVDLCLRARAEGWRIWYCADAHVIHHESQSGPARWTHVRENIERLQVIHGDHRSE